MGDIFGVLLTVLLLAANAFFVGAEFALISARRDRLEALAEQGKRRAVTVIRAGQNLSVMLAGAQLGHHGLLDPAGPGRRTGGGSPAREAVRPPRRAGRPSAHGVVRHRDHDRRGAARAARRDGAEEHRDRGPRVGGHAARSAVSGLGSRWRDPSSRSTTGVRTWRFAQWASRPNPNWRTRFRRSSSPR